MPVDPAIVEAIATSNMKTAAEMGSHSLGLAMENAVSHQAALNQIRELALGNLAKNMTEIDPTQAVSMLKATSGNEVASQISTLLAALSSGQQQAKVAQTTPPPTP